MLLARRLRHALTGARSFSVEVFSADHVLSPDTDSATTTTTTTERGGSGRGRDRLGRRLLSLIYPKRSAIIALRKWTEKGNTAQKYQLNHIVRELRKLKRYKHALEICEWMTIQEDIKLLPGDYAVHLDLVAKVRGLASAEKFFEDLPEQMKGPSTCTALLHTYVQNKLSTKAEALMEEMSSNGFLRCALPYNNMLHLYISSGQTDKVPKMIQELKKNTSPDVMTYNLWLNTFANSNDVLGAAEEVLLDMRQREINADWVTHSVLANIYIKSALTKKARESLKEMEKNISRKERSAHCSLITLHTNLADKDDVYRIWEEMKLKYRKMSDAEYTCMLASLVKLGEIEEAESIYDEWESVSRTGDSRVANVLLAFYIRSDMMEKAENFHDRMVQKEIKPSYTTWELMAWGYLGRKKMDKVLDCLKNALSRLKKWEPDYPIVKSVFDNLEMSGDIEIAEKFLIMLRDAGYVTTQIYNSLLKTYAKAGKMPLIIVERMTKDNVQLDEETRRLMKLTSKLCVGEVSTLIS